MSISGFTHIGPSAAILLIGLMFSIPSEAARVQPIQNIENAPIPAGLSLDQIRSGIIRAGTVRNWVIVEESPGRLVGTLHLRSHMAQVSITFDQSTYSITYRDSDNLKWKPGYIHRNYNSWVRNLNGDIQQALALIL